MDSLSKPNNYYDRCYGCERTHTDGWGDELCRECRHDFALLKGALGIDLTQEEL